MLSKVKIFIKYEIRKKLTINFLFLREIVIPTNKVTRSSQSFYCFVKFYVYEIKRL
jgi:hypothetical protein